MRRFRVRFTVRTLMIVVALVGLSIGGWKEYQRGLRLREDYEGTAFALSLQANWWRFEASRTHDQWEAECREVERLNRGESVPPELARRKADYYARMQAKYERAARFPWWPVAPDPPEPR